MKKSSAKGTNSETLEAKFDRGEDVLDYFDQDSAKVLLPEGNPSGAHSSKRTAVERTVTRESAGEYGKPSPKTRDYTKRNEGQGGAKKGKYMDVKSGGRKFKGLAKESDKRRK